jgi:hypothetical protein
MGRPRPDCRRAGAGVGSVCKLHRETLRRLNEEDTPKLAGGVVCTGEDTTCKSCYTGCPAPIPDANYLTTLRDRLQGETGCDSLKRPETRTWPCVLVLFPGCSCS